ncbi:sarcosine oxidase subunit alpha family protein [Roseospira goensis]|uniref:Sarcosine oxidase subunit alpha n=1 Tax=Roseospira goensis TaxID=391922 RepID=A0A7W6S1I5_9PROT|nr:sarcosine oxidase subunit alpha family protein [Roseospira goensis]MBB4287134.1 sarcosine oxidase subunit alpha [Roseospira goensis]
MSATASPKPARQPERLEHGGLIDRGRALTFRFDGRALTGHPGDTLASALLANGVRLVARSFKYHRPRGIVGDGPEEPSALVAVGAGARHEPNTRATVVDLVDGLEARSQNRWPLLRWDAGALTGLVGAFAPVGFYYKTFMTPARLWPLQEAVLRRLAGMGSSPTAADPDAYAHRGAHCDLLVVGAGPAGLMAAWAAARAGARVILADERAALGGCLLRERVTLDGAPGHAWVAAVLDALRALGDRVTLLPRTTVTGQHDHGFWQAVERVADHDPAPAPDRVRQRLWQIRARQTVLATGAIERPLVFAGNDRPGVMLASAARAYVNQYAVAPGRRAVLFASHDEGYRTALDLHAAGIQVPAVVDPRAGVRGPLPDRVRALGIPVRDGHVIADTQGTARRGLNGVTVNRLVDGGPDMVPVGDWIDADLLAVAGGWSPTLHLHAQAGAKPVWDAERLAFLPDPERGKEWMCGGCAGVLRLDDALADGLAAGQGAAEALGLRPGAAPPLPTVGADDPAMAGSGQPQTALWAVPKPAVANGKRFVDIQDDVTVEDIALAHREGYASVEHLKRYTTLGMGTDQGKTSNVAGLALLAEARGEPIPAVGTTTFRAPYTPVTLGALAGRHVGAHIAPVRRSPMHAAQAEMGAVFQPTGLWLRPRHFPRDGETLAEAVRREVIATRSGVGLCDVSFLGKIDVQGPDAAEFLNRVYINGWKGLAVGKARYGLMLREDGLAMDDGTTARLADDHFAMTTTTANAVAVMTHLEYGLQVLWPELDVRVVSTTDEWAAVALAGPKSRRVLEEATDLDVSNDALPFMGVTEGTVCGLPARLFRISFSGELAYEINVPAGYGDALWRRLVMVGKPFGLTPYGAEALGVMRIEKGHVAGPELDGRTTPHDLGLGRMVSTKKSFIGRRLLERAALTDPERPALVGLVPEDGATVLAGGSQIVAVADRDTPPPVPMIGHVSSGCAGPGVGHPVALGFLKGGLARWEGQTVLVSHPLKGTATPARVVAPHVYDPEGRRQHA